MYVGLYVQIRPPARVNNNCGNGLNCLTNADGPQNNKEKESERKGLLLQLFFVLLLCLKWCDQIVGFPMILTRFSEKKLHQNNDDFSSINCYTGTTT